VGISSYTQKCTDPDIHRGLRLLMFSSFLPVVSLEYFQAGSQTKLC
jgi:hypothetical protein